MMHGYTRLMLVGGWKYAFAQISKRTSWRARRWANVHLPKTQDQTRELDFDVSHSPELPRPFHVTDGEEVATGVVTCHDADRVADREILVQALTFAELPGVTVDISV